VLTSGFFGRLGFLGELTESLVFAFFGFGDETISRLDQPERGAAWWEARLDAERTGRPFFCSNLSTRITSSRSGHARSRLGVNSPESLVSGRFG
jgi:hypothetical protein